MAGFNILIFWGHLSSKGSRSTKNHHAPILTGFSKKNKHRIKQTKPGLCNTKFNITRLNWRGSALMWVRRSAALTCLTMHEAWSSHKLWLLVELSTIGPCLCCQALNADFQEQDKMIQSLDVRAVMTGRSLPQRNWMFEDVNGIESSDSNRIDDYKIKPFSLDFYPPAAWCSCYVPNWTCSQCELTQSTFSAAQQ